MLEWRMQCKSGAPTELSIQQDNLQRLTLVQE